jgi:ABC-type nitrate/sulfonate/bicarbonate transport system substrate-binding protein
MPMTNQRPTDIARAAALVLGLCMASAPHAAPSASARQEIDYLLGYIGRSGCSFNRNGS